MPQQQALFVSAVSIIWNEYQLVFSDRQPGLFCWVEGCVPVLFPFYKSKVLLWLCLVQMGEGSHLLCVLLVYTTVAVSPVNSIASKVRFSGSSFKF